jgi:hypothetical protein
LPIGANTGAVFDGMHDLAARIAHNLVMQNFGLGSRGEGCGTNDKRGSTHEFLKHNNNLPLVVGTRSEGALKHLQGSMCRYNKGHKE